MAPMQPEPMKPEEVKERLRQVRFPGRSRDIVALGLVKSIGVQGERIEIELAPDTVNVEKIAAVENEVRQLLAGLRFREIEIHSDPPYDDASMLLGGPSVNPLQVDLREYGLDPTPDPDAGGAPRLKDLLAHGSEAPATSPQDRPDDPEALEAFAKEGPLGNSDPTYDGRLPVFQWQIDPEATDVEGHKAKLSIGSWNYVVAWLVHARQDLLYGSIQARHWISYGGKARPNPAGRTEAVNLVYDRQREGIVAIYGTVRDFRPFVEAFRRALVESAEPEEAAAA